MAKRAFDITFSFLGLVAVGLFLFLIASAIVVDSGFPVFYRGVRVGRGGKPFRIFKFRSMVSNAEKLGATSTNAADPRLTRVGKFIRKFKFDELPQLLNVLKGEMSFVGPRPEVQRFVDMYSNEEKKILTVRPGITDWSSIKFHNEPEIIHASGIADADEAYALLIRPEKLRLQLKYVAEQSVWTDVKIICSTLKLLIHHENG
jgi:lipopolysaccharide/colanic/teichoic acid biosynthesis glycosyltransferase